MIACNVVQNIISSHESGFLPKIPMLKILTFEKTFCTQHRHLYQLQSLCNGRDDANSDVPSDLVWKCQRGDKETFKTDC